MINCYFINSIDRTPLLFKLNSFLFNQTELEESPLCYSLAPRCNDSLAEAEYKFLILSYFNFDVNPNPPEPDDCYFVDYDGEEFADYDNEFFTC